MDGWRDWAEERWEAIAVAASVVGALTVSVFLMVTFNVIATRVDRSDREAADVRPIANTARSRAVDALGEGAL